MKISVIIPALDPLPMIDATLGSLVAQSGTEAEFVVVDSSRKPLRQTISPFSDPRFRWIPSFSSHQIEMINQGLASAEGDVLVCYRPGDLCTPGALVRVADHFRMHPECSVLYGSVASQIEDGSNRNAQTPAAALWSYDELLCECFLSPPGVFWRRELLSRFGSFDERLVHASDYDYWLRIGRQLPFQPLSNPPLAMSIRPSFPVDIEALSEALEVARMHSPSARCIMRHLKRLAEQCAKDTEAVAAEPLTNRSSHRIISVASEILIQAERLQLELDDTMLDELERSVQALQIHA